MADRYYLMLSMVLGAQKSGASSDPIRTPAEVLESIITGRFTSDISNGKTLLRTSEAGGEVEFALMQDLSPAEISALAIEALGWLNQQPDPLNPVCTPRRIKRLRVSFSKASA